MKRIYTFLIALVFVAAGCSDTVVSPDTELSETEIEALSTQPAAVNHIKTGASTAMVQVIHNSPERAARFVDVYVNGELAIDNFKFRRAIPFVELPTDLDVAIAPRNSKSVHDAIATFHFDLNAGEHYVVVASGLLSAEPGFDLFPYAPAKKGSGDSHLVSLLAFHGSPNAPTVDVVARDVATLVDDISFGEFQGYVDVPPAKYTLDVTLADQSATAASFKANLRGLGGGAAVVLATGFLGEKPPFGLIAVLPDGTVIRLPEIKH